MSLPVLPTSIKLLATVDLDTCEWEALYLTTKKYLFDNDTLEKILLRLRQKTHGGGGWFMDRFGWELS